MGRTRRLLLDKTSNLAFSLGQRAFLNPDVRVAERRGERISYLWYKLDKKHRERAVSNLGMAFPDWPQEKREEVARETFRHFGRVLGDVLRTPLRSHDEVNEAEVIGREHLFDAHKLGKGVLIITAHYGNWERFAQWFTANGLVLNVVARDANQSGITDRITAIRNLAGANVLSRGNSARQILTKLKQGELVGILNDQNNGDCYVPFFDKPCGTAMGPAVMHLRTGAPLVPCYFTRLGPGKYQAKFFSPIYKDDSEKDPEALTAKLNLILESMIREHPEQWLWVHDRWKSARRKGLL